MSSAYLKVEEADEIVKQLYMSNDINRAFWESLSTDDKEVLLNNATKLIDNKRCLWKGTRVSTKQEHAFPRMIFRGIPITRCTVIEIDNTFLQGIVELAIENWQFTHSDEYKMLQNGIASYKVKDASITFSDGTKYNVLGIPRDIWNNYFAQYSDIC